MTENQKDAIMIVADLYKKGFIDGDEFIILVKAIFPQEEQSSMVLPSNPVDNGGRLWTDPRIVETSIKAHMDCTEADKREDK